MSIEAGTQTDISDMTGDEKEGTLSIQLTEVPLNYDNANNGPTTIDTHNTQVCTHIIEKSSILDSNTNCNKVLKHVESGSKDAKDLVTTSVHCDSNNNSIGKRSSSSIIDNTGTHEDRNRNKRKCVDDNNKDSCSTGDLIVQINNDDENVLSNLSQPNNIIVKKQKVCND